MNKEETCVGKIARACGPVSCPNFYVTRPYVQRRAGHLLYFSMRRGLQGQLGTSFRAATAKTDSHNEFAEELSEISKSVISHMRELVLGHFSVVALSRLSLDDRVLLSGTFPGAHGSVLPYNSARWVTHGMEFSAEPLLFLSSAQTLLVQEMLGSRVRFAFYDPENL